MTENASMFIASGPKGKGGDKPSPREAALAFFDAYPTARKCDVREYERDPDRPWALLRRYVIGAPGGRVYRDFYDVTRKQAGSLPAA